ncbi:MAG: diguanylate cyclase [Novosphingobium sp.]|nr:diguanylate cyclase [Novosphingobium sp.]
MEPHFHQPLPTLRQILARAHMRLVVFAIVLLSICLIFSGYFVILSQARHNLDLAARTLAYSVEPAIIFGDVGAIGEATTSIASDSELGSVEVRDSSDEVIHHWQRPVATVTGLVGNWLEDVIGPAPASVRIRHGGRTIGSVTVKTDMARLTSFLLVGLLISLCCLGITLVASRILARHLREDVLEPLDRIVKVAHAARAERDFSQRAPRSGIVEVDRFSQDFNALLAELEKWHLSMLVEKEVLEHRANHDPMTGLGNRALFDSHLTNTMSKALTDGSAFALIYVDVDNFKPVNDSFGHAIGDAILVEIGVRLNNSVRPADKAFRLGGDEFALICAPVAEAARLGGLHERIATAMGQPFQTGNGTDTRLTVSIGMAIFPDDGQTAAGLTEHADSEMYRHKQITKSGS